MYSQEWTSSGISTNEEILHTNAHRKKMFSCCSSTCYWNNFEFQPSVHVMWLRGSIYQEIVLNWISTIPSFSSLSSSPPLSSCLSPVCRKQSICAAKVSVEHGFGTIIDRMESVDMKECILDWIVFVCVFSEIISFATAQYDYAIATLRLEYANRPALYTLWIHTMNVW